LLFSWPSPPCSWPLFAILPRSSSDLATGPSGSGSTGLPTGVRTSNGAAGIAGSGAGWASAGSVDDVTPDTDLAVLAQHVGARVRVGGLIDTMASDGFDLNDGTAVAHVLLNGDAHELLPYLRRQDAIAAAGRVEQLGDALAVVVEAAGDLVRVGDLGQAVPIGMSSASPPPATAAADADASFADAVSSVLQPQPGPLGLVAMAGLSLASLVGTLLRRRRARRLLRAAITARLATLQPSSE